MLSMLFFLLACGDKADDTAILDVSNAGPDGLSIASDYCGPDDGAAISLTINTDSLECGTAADANFNVQITIFTDQLVSGQVYPLATAMSADGNANYYFDGGSANASEGEVHLDFSGEWQDGTEYTGYYWINGDDFPLMEGSFDGVYCITETFCG